MMLENRKVAANHGEVESQERLRNCKDNEDPQWSILGYFRFQGFFTLVITTLNNWGWLKKVRCTDLALQANNTCDWIVKVDWIPHDILRKKVLTSYLWMILILKISVHLPSHSRTFLLSIRLVRDDWCQLCNHQIKNDKNLMFEILYINSLSYQ